MNRPLVIAIATLLPLVANASAPVDSSERAATQVDSFPVLGQMHSWHAVDRDSVVVWATPWRAYLVELSRPSPELRSAFGIGLTSTAGRVYARFDDVIVDGWRYPIRSIYSLDREEARALVSKRRQAT